MKSLADDLPLMQAIFLRGLLVSAALGVALVATRTPRTLSRRDWGIVVLRTAGEVAAAFLFIAAIFNAPLANMTAILQALPLTVTLAGALFLGEPVDGGG
jgi:drug/metabolite transporter (DMT)-like permease